MQSEWSRVSFLIVRNDLSVVEAEFIRPRDWIESLGLVKGARIDLAVPELEIDGLAEVTAIRPCPPIAEGEGRVVTGRFVTRDVANIVRITIATGTEIRATDVHPVWSVDREDWVPAGKLEPGEQVDTLDGPVAVTSVEPLDRHPAVYNLEVHGEHVYRIAVDGVLVHNAGPGDCLEGIASNTRKIAGSGPKSGFLEISENTKSANAVKHFQGKKPVDFRYDPESGRFVMGNNPLGHSGMPGFPESAPGGRIRLENGKLVTDEHSGHFGELWTPKIREQFVDFMKKHGVTITHTIMWN